MKYNVCALALAMVVTAAPAWAAELDTQPTREDPRFDLNIQGADKIKFLGEMRQMLASIQGVLEGIAEQDRNKIKRAAKYSGMRMARATPSHVRASLPKAFKEIGGPTHRLFEELVIRADTDDMQDLTALTAELMKNCLSCHAQFRAD